MCHILRIIYCMYIYDTTLPTCALHNCILLVDLKINYSLNTRDFQGAFIPYGIHNSILTTTGRFPVCVLICVPDCTPVKVTAHQQPLSCPQPAHKTKTHSCTCGQKYSLCNHHKSNCTNDILSQSRLPRATLAVLYHLPTPASSTSLNLCLHPPPPPQIPKK